MRGAGLTGGCGHVGAGAADDEVAGYCDGYSKHVVDVVNRNGCAGAGNTEEFSSCICNASPDQC